MTALAAADVTPSWTADAIVDLTRYPIDRPGGPEFDALIVDCRARLAGDGLCLLPAFIRPAALTAMTEEAMALAPQAHRRREMKTAYDCAAPAGLPPDHPRRRRHLYSMAAIAYDEFGADSPTRALYEWDVLTAFIAAAVGGGPLFRCADELASCTVTMLADGDEHGWHYDSNDFVVSLLLQTAEDGGHFELWPHLRTPTDERYDIVGRLFDGEHIGLLRPEMQPGTLSLFRGQRSLHHVTRVGGPRPRLIALFSYDRGPDMRFSDAVRMSVYGRLR